MTDEKHVPDYKQANSNHSGQHEEFTLEDLEKIIPNKHHRESFLHLLEQLDADRAAMIALKGHLVIEEKLTAAIEKFVFHPEHLDDARLSFAQKLTFARALSLDENKNSMWDLVTKLNTLRNKLSHSLEGASREKAMNALRAAYAKERDGKLEDWEEKDESLLILGTVSLCLGFLDSFEQEVERFKDHVNLLDRVVNPHRHPRPDVEPAKP